MDAPDDDDGLGRRLPALGSLLSILFAAERREVQKAMAKGVKGANPGSTGQCLEYLLEYVKLSSSKEGTVVHICVPLLQHIVKSKESSNRKKSLLILQWLLGRDESWMAVANTLLHVISSSDYDHTTKFGACLAIKEFVNTETKPVTELTLRRSIPIFATCVPDLVEQVCHASCISGKQKLPTRLSVAAADCILVITAVLAVGVPDNDGKESWDIMLWNQLGSIITVVSELCEWNHFTRPLHARGLMEVGRHLQEIRGTCEGERGTGILALKTCCQDYASLICSEDLKISSNPDRLQKLMLALQHFSGDRGSRNMRRYILTCLALFLGRVDAESIGLDPKSELLELLIRQLFSNGEESVSLVLAILKFFPSEDNGLIRERETFLPLFMEQLETTRITIPNAIVPLVAECFAKHPSPDLERLFRLLNAEIAAQRRNALDVIDELVKQSFDSDSSTNGSLRRSIASILLKRLEDEDLINRIASPAFAKLDTVSIIPELVQRLHDSSEKVQSGASTALLSVMKGATDQNAVVSILLECTGNLSQQADVERVVGLIPRWASTVKEWDGLAVFILDKMFADPSNSLFPRFLSVMATYWVDIYHVVFSRVLRALVECNANPIQEGDQNVLHQHLFRKLSPLLVLRVLPLRTYDHVDCKELYSGPEAMWQDYSIASLLVKWMCEPSEFDDVRRLAAELCGHLRPEAVLPLVTDQLKEATQNGYILKLKSCIYAICNSLMIRGHQTLNNPLIGQIKAVLATALLWPTSSEEVQKAQHGCIDGFAIMIRAELDSGDDGVLQAVISCLQDQPCSIPSLCGMSTSEFSNYAAGQNVDSYSAVPLSFRVCMGNVLISCCSKIKDSSHEHFARIIVPAILSLLQSEREAIIRVACTQLLFSAVYNVKAACMRLYANDLLTVSLAALKDDSVLHEERLAGAKLLAALLVHEDILEEIRPSFHHIQQVLTSMDPVPEVRKLCEQLLTCLSS